MRFMFVYSIKKFDFFKSKSVNLFEFIEVAIFL